MNISSIRQWAMAMIGCLALLDVAGCSTATSELWYKAGKNQVDFDVDSNECLIIAEEMGRQATLTGKRKDLEVFYTTYNNCLYSKGWGHTPPGVKQKKVAVKPLVNREENRIGAFGRSFLIPPQFELISNQIYGFEDVRMQSLQFKSRKNPVYISLIFQQALSRSFDLIDYPVNAPFFLYDRADDNADQADELSWAVFSGDFQGEWIAGIGAYFLIDKNHRISCSITQAIDAPKEDPPPGLRLTRGQKEQIDAFSNLWLKRVKAIFSGS